MKMSVGICLMVLLALTGCSKSASNSNVANDRIENKNAAVSPANTEATKEQPVIAAPPATSEKQTPPKKIDLSRIQRIAPKGRVQDNDFYDKYKVIDDLIGMGKSSIPLLIDKLENNTKLDHSLMDYWSETYIGDLAFIILGDFFLNANWTKSTIPEASWDRMLESPDNSIDAEQQLRRYLARHGRKSLKVKWQRIWETYKDRLYWDEAELCFKLK